MSAPVLRVENLVKRYGGVVATDALSLDVRAGEVHAVIGPNGAGKTTTLAQICGELRPDEGDIYFLGERITGLPAPACAARGLGRTFQITQLLEDFSAIDNVALAVQAVRGHSFRFLADARRDRSLREPAQRMLGEVGLGERAEVRTADLAHGEQKQLELAVALVRDPKLLVLDEPMAGLGTAESEQMVAALSRLKGQIPILLVEHDMDAVFTLADRISVLVNGRCIASGVPAEIRQNAEVRAAYLGEGGG